MWPGSRHTAEDDFTFLLKTPILERLKRYMDEQRLESVKLSYFGTAPPEAYGIRHQLLPSVMRPIPERLCLSIRPWASS